MHVIDLIERIFFKLEVFFEFADERFVLGHVSASGMFIVEFLVK